ncbi:MAG: S8 family serine peptidase [Acidobacteriota bacterium]|nr:MAG: S8 family serine peptidase [Acidobacteriota bacterium]
MKVRFRLLFLLTVTLLLSGLIFGHPSGGPPFRSGEVAVYADPAELQDYTVSKFLPFSGISIVQVESGREWGEVQSLQRRGFKAGLNRKAIAFATANDAFYQPYQWHLTAVQAEEAWDVTRGLGVTVAVLDTGLRLGGPDGVFSIVSPYDAVDGDSDPTDVDGHGTHVSGTIAQTTNNGIGVAGLAYEASIMPVKVLDDSGSGSFADISEGIYYAVANGASVINMSLGTNARFALTSDPVMDPALEHAYNSNVTVVCASGNDGSRNNVSYPAIHPLTIAVGATDYRNSVVRYSNRGQGLDLVAPGGDTSKDLNGDGYGDGVLQETFGGSPPSWGYYFYQGTSMASPHVAAAAALLYSYGVTSAEEVRTQLLESALDVGDAGVDSTSGHGLLQAHSALTWTSDPGGGGGGGGGCTDNDGDGFCVPDDCNDNNASVFPGANDTKGRPGRDGIDNDCNGTPDA